MKNKAVFLTFLIALFCLPVSFPLMKNVVDSETHENRTLSSFPTFSDIKTYPAALETYFNDHLPYKNQLVAADASLRSALRLDQTMLDFLTGGQVIRGKDNWLYYNASGVESTLSDYLCNNLYTEEELETIAAGYRALNDQYRAEGITFILFIPPNKEQVYPEFMPDSLVPHGEISRTDQLTAYLKEHEDFPVIYAKEALLREKEAGFQVFYKYDTHWNELGGFVGAQLLKQKLKGESQTLSEVNVEEVDEPALNDLAGVLGLAGSLVEKTDWVVADYEPEVTATVSSTDDQPQGEYLSYHSNADDPRTLVMIKDSFAINMIDPLSKDYANTVFVTDSAQAKEYIRENHPEIVVLEIVERQHFRAELQWRELLEE